MATISELIQQWLDNSDYYLTGDCDKARAAAAALEALRGLGLSSVTHGGEQFSLNQAEMGRALNDLKAWIASNCAPLPSAQNSRQNPAGGAIHYCMKEYRR